MNRERKAAPVLDGPGIPIGPPVGHGTEELPDQVPASQGFNAGYGYRRLLSPLFE
jgi:hypothetical protein